MSIDNSRIARLVKGLAILAFAALLSACGQEQSEPEQARLPVSINEVMASLINHSADPIWIAAWRNPQNVRDWSELEHLARQLQIGGSLLSIPGTGPLDDQWTSNPDWVAWADQLSDAAGRALSAAQSRSISAIRSSGDEIVDICEGCHIDFKPDEPTMNIYGELSPLPSDQ